MDKVVNRKSASVVFSDLDCTLVGKGIIRTWEEYVEHLKKVSTFINYILSQNNYFVIVSSSHHDSEYKIVQKFNTIYNFLLKENKDKIMFFCSNTGKNCVEHIDNIDVYMIDEKVESVDIVLNRLKNSNIDIFRLFGIGDDEKDVDMLFKIQELGGTVGIVADPTVSKVNLIKHLDFNKTSLEDIIDNIIEVEFAIETKRLITKKLAEAKQQSICWQKIMYNSGELNELREKKLCRKQELIEGYRNGTIDNDGLQWCYISAQLADRYFRRYINIRELDGEKVDESIQQRIYLITQNMASQTVSGCENLLANDIIKKMLKI